jgi:hypothetical protein
VLLLIPALTILLPLLKLFPMAYKWSIRQRLLYWYNELKVLERRLERSRPGENAEAYVADIERIDHAARRIRVPLEFSDQHYDLRGHIDLVRRRVTEHQRLGARMQSGAQVSGMVPAE